MFATPVYTRGEVNKAGKILSAREATPEDLDWASDVLANWRACHGYPINTFQATLRTRLRRIDPEAIVAQRLKRAPSVIAKLQRFPTMNLSEMQDIGGLRAVVESVAAVRRLEKLYRNASLKHELVGDKDYIESPKSDGYRSIHLVYKYKNDAAPQYNGLRLELQLRTRVQHAWATAVETMGTFLGQALKSGEGEGKWRDFFKEASAALALLEKTPLVPGFEQMGRKELFVRVAESNARLRVLTKLRGFSIAANKINAAKGSGKYHLVELNSATQSVSIRPFPERHLDMANSEYSKIEKRAQEGERVEAVLVAAGPVDALRKAYPNYFLDTHEFVKKMERIIHAANEPEEEARPRTSGRVTRVSRVSRVRRL